MNTLKALFATACLIAVFNVQPVHAQVVPLDRSVFDSTYPGATVENWNGENGTIIGNNELFDGITYQTSGFNSIRVSKNLLSSFPDGLGSSKLSDLGFFTRSDEVTFDFSQQLTAFSIDINSIAFKNQAFEAIDSNGNIVYSTEAPLPGDPLEQFIGFSDTTSFDSITIKDLTISPYKIDQLEYVDASSLVLGQPVVPEPPTVALMFVALSGIAVFTIRRRILAV